MYIKDVRSQGKRRCVQCGHFLDKRSSSDADVSTFWSK